MKRHSTRCLFFTYQTVKLIQDQLTLRSSICWRIESVYKSCKINKLAIGHNLYGIWWDDSHCQRAEIENFHDKDRRLKETFTNIKILLYIFLKAWTEDTASPEVTAMNQIEVATKWKPANNLKLWQGSVYIWKNSPELWRAVSWEGLPVPPDRNWHSSFGVPISDEYQYNAPVKVNPDPPHPGI